MTIVTMLLPFFGAIALGYLAGQMRWMTAEGVAGMNSFVIRLAMPCLIIKVIAESDIADIFNLGFLAAYIGAELCIYALSVLVTLKVFKRSLAEAAVLGLGAAWGNVGYMGIALTANLVSASENIVVMPALLATAADMVVVTGLTIILVEYDRNSGSVAVQRLIGNLGYKLITHPFIITIILGLGLSFTGVGIPSLIKPSVEFIAGAAGPAALFAIGASLAVRPLKGDRVEIIAPIALKLLALPVFFLGFAILFQMDYKWIVTGLILTALPTAGNVFVIAEQYGSAVQRVSATILLSTLISIGSLIALLAVVL